VGALVVVPVVRCACRLDQARELTATGNENPGRFFQAAAEADPVGSHAADGMGNLVGFGPVL